MKNDFKSGILKFKKTTANTDIHGSIYKCEDYLICRLCTYYFSFYKGQLLKTNSNARLDAYDICVEHFMGRLGT